MSQKSQLKSDLTLETAIQIARQSEMVKSQATDQNSGGRCDLHHTKPEQCFAKDKKSLKCQKAGHFAAVCWFKSVSEVNNSRGGGATNGSSVDR